MNNGPMGMPSPDGDRRFAFAGQHDDIAPKEIMPLVSVIIPTYNRCTFLSRAIASVLNQTFQDYEIVVVDDASEEDAARVVWGCEDRRVRWIRHNKNWGEAASRNTGILQANGELLAFLDDDDEWLPDKLAMQISRLSQRPSYVGGIYTGFYVVEASSGNVLFTKIPKKSGRLYRDLLRHNVIGTPSTLLLRRSCIERIGLFDGSIVYGVDHDLYLRIARHYEFDCIERPLVRYHVHATRMSNDPDVLIRGMKALTKRYGHERGFWINRKVLASGYFDAAIACLERQQREKASRMILWCILMNPFNWMSYHQLICSLIDERRLFSLRRLKRRIFPLRNGNGSTGKNPMPIGHAP